VGGGNHSLVGTARLLSTLRLSPKYYVIAYDHVCDCNLKIFGLALTSEIFYSPLLLSSQPCSGEYQAVKFDFSFRIVCGVHRAGAQLSQDAVCSMESLSSSCLWNTLMSPIFNLEARYLQIEITPRIWRDLIEN
jgi:hypothetical protein